MLVCGLVSGGKDSCFSLVCCLAAGHQLSCLANLRPRQGANPPGLSESSSQELDSQMFQTVGWDSVELLGEAMGLPVFIQETSAVAKEVGRDYLPCPGDEVEDLYSLLARVKEETGCTAVSVGAILSDYQRVRVESVCTRLGLTCLAYLWRREQDFLLKEMIDSGIEAILIKVACLGLDSKHLGKSLGEMEEHLHALSRKYGANVCGEGGEFETFTLDSPIFKTKLNIEQSNVLVHSNDAFAPVCLLSLNLKLGELKENSSGELPLELMNKLNPQRYIEDVYQSNINGESLEDCNCILESLDLSECEVDWSVDSDGWFTLSNVSSTPSPCPTESISSVFEKLGRELSKHGSSLGEVCKVVMYVDSLADYALLNTEYVKQFSINPPVRVCLALGAEALPPGVRCVLCVSGFRGEGQGQGRRETLHVQSVSHWAPANIGPYSQGVLAGGRLCVSGQIGLVPGSMQLVEGGVAREAPLALRHARRVAEAMRKPENLQVESIIGYILGEDSLQSASKCLREIDGKPSINFLMAKSLPKEANVEWEITFKLLCD